MKLFLFLCLLPLVTIAAEYRQVGAVSVDITPDYPVRLSGYGGRRLPNTGVSQHIFAKALAIGSDDEGPAVLVTVDNCGIPASMRDEVLRRLATKTKVRDERFAICSSHTHCAPMILGILPNLFGMDIPAEHMVAIERYTRELTDYIEKAALAALADRKPATLAWGVGKVGFAANRRAFPLKPIDHDLPVLRVTDGDGKVRAIFTSYACHCTTIGIEEIHGDWAGVAQEALQHVHAAKDFDRNHQVTLILSAMARACWDLTLHQSPAVAIDEDCSKVEHARTHKVPHHVTLAHTVECSKQTTSHYSCVRFPTVSTCCHSMQSVSSSCTTSSQANEVACGFGFGAATSLSCHHVGRVWGLCHGQESRFPTASTCCHVMYSAVRHILYHFNEVCP
jgi:hypothetical protein